MKKKITLALGAVGSLAALAEGTTPTMDPTSASQMVQSAQTGLSTLLTTITPYITTLLLAGLAIWAGFKVIGLIKRAFSSAR